MIKTRNNINKDLHIWHYISVDHFIEAIENDGLYFKRISIFEDNFEGSIPKVSYMLNKIDVEKENLKLRDITYANCWHINTHECEAMWKIYGDLENGLAIKTKVANVFESFNKNDDIIIDKMKYIDFDMEDISVNRRMELFFYKRDLFDFENEVRMVIRKEDEINKDGLFINCNLEHLIDTIYVTNEQNKKMLIEALEKHGKKIKVMDSKLCGIPIV